MNEAYISQSDQLSAASQNVIHELRQLEQQRITWQERQARWPRLLSGLASFALHGVEKRLRDADEEAYRMQLNPAQVLHPTTPVRIVGFLACNTSWAIP